MRFLNQFLLHVINIDCVLQSIVCSYPPPSTSLSISHIWHTTPHLWYYRFKNNNRYQTRLKNLNHMMVNYSQIPVFDQSKMLSPHEDQFNNISWIPGFCLNTGVLLCDTGVLREKCEKGKTQSCGSRLSVCLYWNISRLGDLDVPVLHIPYLRCLLLCILLLEGRKALSTHHEGPR